LHRALCRLQGGPGADDQVPGHGVHGLTDPYQRGVPGHHGHRDRRGCGHARGPGYGENSQVLRPAPAVQRGGGGGSGGLRGLAPGECNSRRGALCRQRCYSGVMTMTTTTEWVARAGAGIEGLFTREVAIADPGPGEVLVRLTAATLNY